MSCYLIIYCNAKCQSLVMGYTLLFCLLFMGIQNQKGNNINFFFRLVIITDCPY